MHLLEKLWSSLGHPSEEEASHPHQPRDPKTLERPSTAVYEQSSHAPVHSFTGGGHVSDRRSMDSWKEDLPRNRNEFKYVRERQDVPHAIYDTPVGGTGSTAHSSQRPPQLYEGESRKLDWDMREMDSAYTALKQENEALSHQNSALRRENDSLKAMLKQRMSELHAIEKSFTTANIVSGSEVVSTVEKFDEGVQQSNMHMSERTVGNPRGANIHPERAIPRSHTPTETPRTTPQLASRGDTVSRRNQYPARPLPEETPSEPAVVPVRTEGKAYQNDPSPYAGPEGDRIEVSNHIMPTDLNPREEVQFQYLARSKCFTLIDDSSSMQYSWPQTRAALAGVVDTLTLDVRWEGLDLRFLHHREARSRIRAREEFECVFDSITTWEGEKVMAEKVADVLKESIILINEMIPVVLLIVTDGVAADHEELSEVMICFCQRLNEKRIPKHMFRIHMLQMGDDRKSIKPLHDLRDRVVQQDRERHMLSVVTFHRGRGLLDAETITKLLLALTYIPGDEDPGIGERQPLEVVEAQYQSLERIRTMAER